MNTRWKPVALTCLLLATTSPLYANNDDLDELQTRIGSDWAVLKNDQRHEIKTFTKQEDGKRYRSFKAEVVLDGKMEDYLRVLLDFDHYDRWSWQVMHSELIQQLSPTEYIFYVTHRAPYGVPDRDVVLQMSFEPATANRPYFTIRTKAVPERLPEKPPFVRMAAEDMSVRVTAINANKYQITVEGYVDPGGRMPTWAINFVQRNAPYVTLLGVRRVTKQPEYAETKIPLPFPLVVR
jgi:hypothetical protein